MLPFVSLIIPTFNEENFIGRVLGQLLGQDYPREKIEILVADGRSKDRTREIVGRYMLKNANIQLLDNEKQYVPFALNMGIKAAKGEMIFIIGCHSEYPDNYISKLVQASAELNADNVGGLCVAKPPDKTLKSLSIAQALSCPFGVGNAHFRIGSKSVRQVDTVTFGCYLPSVFDRIGLFDEELIRNQDDEFNARLIKAGGRIYLIPDVSVTYYTRNKVRSVIRMFYQYGLFKPLVSYKIGKPTTFRQLVPLAFTLFLLISFPVAVFFPPSGWFIVAGLCLYLLSDLYFSFFLAFKTSRPDLIFYLPWLFFLLHVSYGWGYLIGLFNFVLLKNRTSKISSSR